MRIKHFCQSRVQSLIVIALVIIAISAGNAQVPHNISYQGMIRSGSTLLSGQHVLHISLYDSLVGGKVIYDESHQTIIVDGVFSVMLGSVTAFPDALLFDRPYYLSVSIDGAQELAPRTPLASAPYALNSHFAELANGLTSDARGVVTSINEVSGAVRLLGDSTTIVTQNGNEIRIHSKPSVSGGIGIQSVSSPDNTIAILNPKGPNVSVGIADDAITTSKLKDGSVTAAKLNQNGATNGQVLKWNGAAWVPSNDLSTTYIAGNGITFTGNSISVSNPLPPGTVNNSTLRYNGTSWVENINLLSSAAGMTTVNNNLLLNNLGPASELHFYEPLASGNHYSSFAAQVQNADIIYQLPANPPSLNQTLTATSVVGAGPYTITLGWQNNAAGNSWLLAGNIGTIAGTNFLGTTDNQPMYIQVRNNTTVINSLILDTNGSIRRDAGGNLRGADAVDLQSKRSNATEVASGNNSFIGSGFTNTASGVESVVAGGFHNVASAIYSTVGGGENNRAYQYGDVVAGGGHNRMDISAVSGLGQESIIGGGFSNQIFGSRSSMLGGYENYIDGDFSVLVGGRLNNLRSNFSFIGGGQQNTIVDGGSGNVYTNLYNVITGGLNNSTDSSFTFIGGGNANQINGNYNVISGGGNNTANGESSVIGGGRYNTANGLYGGIFTGSGNYEGGLYSSIGGGRNNYINDYYSSIPGGAYLHLQSRNSFGFNAGSSSADSAYISASNTAFFGNVNMWLGNTNNTASQLRFYEAQNGGVAFPGATTNYSSFQAGVQTADINYILPKTQPGVNQVFAATSVTGAGPYAVTLGWADNSNSGSVIYGPTSLQATLTPRTTPLFNIAYISTAPNANAAGAMITSSAGSGGNFNATGLTLTSTGTGTGNTTGLLVSATGSTGTVRAIDATGRVNIDAPSSYDIGGNPWLWMGPNTTITSTFVGNTENYAESGGNNTMVGYQAGYYAASGGGNTFVGSQSGELTGNGYYNAFFGFESGKNNSVGFSNSFFGYNTGVASDGNANSFFGSGSGILNKAGSNNTMLGYNSGDNETNGGNNTFVGSISGITATTGSGNTTLGASADLASGTLANATAIGYLASVGASNSMVLGAISGINGATIDAKIGIGTTTPQEKLNVENGNILLSRSGANGTDSLRFQGTGTGTSNFTAGAQSTTTINYTLPITQPTANQVLSATAITGAGPYAVTLGWANGGGGNAWNLTGNSGTTAGTNFLGTTDNQAMEILVKNGTTVNNGIILNSNGSLQRTDFGNARGTSAVDLQIYNIGSSSTQVSSGEASVISGGRFNTSSGVISTIGGGFANIVSGDYATVSGGYENNASANNSSVGGGNQNTANGTYSTIAGGQGNTAGSEATVGGGLSNGASGYNSTISGGDANIASGLNSTVGAGLSNNAIGDFSSVLGGKMSTANGNYAVIVGGRLDSATADYAFIGGGSHNKINSSASYAAISGGELNVASGDHSFVGGGKYNNANGTMSAVTGGNSNNAAGNYSTIAGGSQNITSSDYVAIGGGLQNSSSGEWAAIPGGNQLALNGDRSFGFNANNSGSTAGMTIGANNTAVFGNADIWLANTDNTAHQLRFYEAQSTAPTFPAAATNFTSFQAGIQTADIIYTLPTSQPTTNQVLSATAITGVGPYNVTLGWATSGATAWNLTGNNGTTAGTNFIGTIDSQAFEIHVFDGDAANKGSQRVMRYEPNATSANIIGGYSGNTMGPSSYGSVIAGGGNQTQGINSIDAWGAFIASGANNTVHGTLGSIAGGVSNIITSASSVGVIAGGESNTVSGTYAAIVGGSGNNAEGYASISGGYFNTVVGDWSSISGGSYLILQGANSFGFNNANGFQAKGATITASNVAYFGNVDLWIGNTGSGVGYGSARQLRFYQDNSGNTTYPATTYYSSFQAPTSFKSSITYTLPDSAPVANGNLLLATSGTSSTWSWSTGLVWDNTNARLGINTTTPSHPFHSVNSGTTDEVAAVYGNSTGSTTNQAIGLWGDASNTATTNTGTIGILATGNGNTTAGQTNVALQINDGEFTMGRTTEAPSVGSDVNGATGGTAYSAEGPSGIIELTLGAAGNLVTAAPTANTIQKLTTITITNRYVQAGSIVLLNIVGMTDDGIAPDPRDAAFILNVDNTASGSFSVRVKMIPAVTSAVNYSVNDKVRIGYMIVNKSK